MVVSLGILGLNEGLVQVNEVMAMVRFAFMFMLIILFAFVQFCLI